MSTEAARPTPFTRFDQLRFGREVIRIEGEALVELSRRLGSDFCEALDRLAKCRGNVIVTGIGKAGHIGQKLAATLASTGTRSHFLHPAEAVHGDLGRVHADDVVLALSFSGESEEVVRLLKTFEEIGAPVVAITGKVSSTLAGGADVVLDLGPLQEACSLGLAPSTSTTAMLALGDALALVLSRMQDFRPEDFSRYHPGGSLGRRLAVVDDIMRPLSECRVAPDAQTIREVLVNASRPGRRSGAIMLTSDDGQLSGIFTDSDLARLLESKCDQQLDQPITELMTQAPLTITAGQRLTVAIELLAERKISELPVIDEHARPIGLLDITDVVGYETQAVTASEDDSSSAGGESLETTESFSPKTIPFPNPSGGEART